jgi:signal transduction histidine kinase/ligand-binding sensor domain-containing protein
VRAASRFVRVAFAAGVIAFAPAITSAVTMAGAPSGQTPASPASKPAATASAPAVDLYQRLEEMHHTAWTGKDGLTGSANALAQTADGFLWIGTTSGVFRFDGVAFERFRPAGGELPGAAVFSLFATHDGGLWIGFTSGGASFIAANGQLTNYTVEQGLPVGTIRAFTQDHDGTIWLAATGGLARLEGGRWRTVRMDWNYPCRSAWQLHVQADGTLWVGGASPDKLLFLPKGTRAFQDTGMTPQLRGFVSMGRTVFVSDGGSTVHQIRRGPDGLPIASVFLKQSHSRIGLDRDGGLWVAGTLGITRFRLDNPDVELSGDRMLPTAERFTSEHGLSGRVWAVLPDREGNVWAATPGGLHRFRHRNLSWRTEDALGDSAYLATDRNGDAWVMSWRAPYLWRARDGEVVPGAPPEVRGAISDRDGTIWILGDNAFLHWKDGRFVPVPPPPEVVARGYNFSVLAAATDRTGRLWASVNGLGQFYRDRDLWTFLRVLPQPDRADWTATKAHVDADDRLWLVYRDELAMLDGGKTRLFTKADGLVVGPILAIAGRDRVWVGGETGIAFLHDGRFHAIRTNPDADFGTVSDIVFTSEGVWLGAAAGIVHIPDAELRRLIEDATYRPRYQLFDLVSDLPEPLRVNRTGPAAAADGAGHLWFLTNSGLARVDPRRIVRNAVPPPVVIRAVTADDKAYAPRGDVSLPALTRTLRIDYTALSLTIPERVRFRYRLEGWETDWHDAGTRREVFYTDLEPGRYAFRVLACNNDGVWNDTGATLAFTVAPAWYQTWWFSGVIAISLIAAIVIMYRLRVRRVSAALSARFDDRLAERTRIARELHDTLLQTVQGSKMVTDDALDRAEDPEHVRRALERLSEWLDRAVAEGRAALNSLRASTVEVNDQADAFRRAADNPTKPTGMAVAVTVIGAPRNLHPIVRDEIYRIGYEAMNNAYAHSGAARLEIELEYGHDLILRVIDDGAGIDPEIAGSGKRGRFGLPGMRERAANIGATLDIEGSASGTRLTLVVPGRGVFQRGHGSLPSS